MSTKGTRKSWPAIIGGLVVAAIAAYFGVDFGDGNTGTTTSPSAAPTATAPHATHASHATQARDGSNAEETGSSGLSSCALSSLPEQADIVVEDILAGGPFEHPDRDGTRFGNYEGILPQESRNYYREYTVDTPGLNHRGERRIVTGGGTETDPDVWYYTDDHYESFCEIPDAEN